MFFMMSFVHLRLTNDRSVSNIIIVTKVMLRQVQ